MILDFHEDSHFIVVVILADQCASSSFGVETACSPNSVEVFCFTRFVESILVFLIWHVKVDDHVHATDVNTSGQQVCRNEEVDVSKSELSHDLVSLNWGHTSHDLVAGVALICEVAIDVVDVNFCVHEDDDLCRVYGLDQLAEESELGIEAFRIT